MPDYDLLQLKTWFTDYCRDFYSGAEGDDRNVQLKQEHSCNVADNMGSLVESISLGIQDSRLAMAVALLHDVGRFEQYRRFRTFRDSISVNHAALGVQILKDSDVLNDFADDDRITVLKAVGLHNAFVLPPRLEERVRLHACLVRDADKLDIWRVFIDYYTQSDAEKASAVGLGFPDIPSYSEEVLRELNEGKMVQLSMLRTLNDFKLLQISWVYDLNFPHSYVLLNQRGYLDRLFATLPPDSKLQKAMENVSAFVQKAMNRNSQK